MDDARRSLWALVGQSVRSPAVGTTNVCRRTKQHACGDTGIILELHRVYRRETSRALWALGNLYDRATVLRAIFTRWPTTTIEQRWCFCWGGSGVWSRSRRQSAGARPEGHCTELFEELVERDSFRELHVQ